MFIKYEIDCEDVGEFKVYLNLYKIGGKINAPCA